MQSKESTILEDFYNFKPKIDTSWRASEENQILYGKIDFISNYAHCFNSDELKEVEEFFMESNDGTLFKVFNKVRWDIRKNIGDKANGLFSMSEFYYIDWLSKSFVLKEQTKENLKNHLENITNKISELEFSNIEADKKEKLYTSINVNFVSDLQDNSKEINALRASYSNIKNYVTKMYSML